jgi:F0F1-type ATP synthase epsilon subunit
MITVITEAACFKNNFEKKEAQKNKELLFKEINRGYSEPLDREVFKKTVEERNNIFSMKMSWKSDMKLCFPISEVRKKYNNPICK